MTDAPTPAPADLPDDTGLWLETFVVLCAFVVPNVWRATADRIWPRPATPQPILYSEIDLIVLTVQFAPLVLFLIWRSGEPFARFGLGRPRWADLFAGLVVFGLCFVAWYWYDISGMLDALRHRERDAADLFTRPRGAGEYALVVLAGCCNGFTEELVMRGYLIRRLGRLLGSPVLGWLATSLFFAAYHVHYGPAGAVGVLLSGLVLGAAFCLTGRLWPCVVAHALLDIVPMLMLPAVPGPG